MSSVAVTPSPTRHRVLLVDDSAIQAQALRRILVSSGFEVAVASGGSEALEHLAANESALVLSDVRMPGMDGFALCRAIKARRRGLPVVLVTAFAEPPDIVRGLAAGADGFLSKSSSPAQLRSRLTRALAAAAGADVDEREPAVSVHYQDESFEIEASRDKMIDYLLSTFEDLVAAKEAESEQFASQAGLRASVQILRAVGDALPAAIVCLDSEARIVGCNAAWHLGSRRNELAPPQVDVDADYAELCERAFGGTLAGRRIAEAVRRVAQGAAGVEAVDYGFGEGDGERWFEARVTPISGAGRVAAFVGHFDITGRKLPERLKDEFMSHVSHELRSPLAAVHQFLSLVLDGLAGELLPEQREYLDVAWSNTEQLETMIDDLLDVTRGQSGRLTLRRAPNRIEEVVLEVLRAQRPRALDKEVELTEQHATGLPLVEGDHRRLRQVVTNLVENAIKFTPPGGTVTVHTEPSERDRRFVEVSVSDTGRGIPESARDKVFDYLYQLPDESDSSRRGLGLGLHICKTLVEAHGGEIWVEGNDHGGSTFRFTIPNAALPAGAQPSSTGRVPALAAGGGARRKS